MGELGGVHQQATAGEDQTDGTGHHTGDEAEYRAWLFGPFRVHRNGSLLGAGAPRKTASATLLKLLLLEPDRAWQREELVEVLWPDLDSTAARRRLHAAVHELRRFLEPDADHGAASRHLEVADGLYRFAGVSLWRTDVWDVEADTRQAWALLEAGRAKEAVELLSAVVKAYAATFLPEDLYADTFWQARARIDLARAHAQRSYLRALAETGSHHQVLQVGLDLMSEDPLSPDVALGVAAALRHAQTVEAAIRFLAAFAERCRAETGEVDARVDALLGQFRSRGRAGDAEPRSARDEAGPV